MLKALIGSCSAMLRGQQSGDAARHCLTFSLNGIHFGIDTRMIKRIVRYGILAKPTDRPASVIGFQRHEGNMIPVLDIAARYGTQPLLPGRRTCLVVVGLGYGKWQCDIGVMVDEVLGVLDFRPEDVCAVPEAAHTMMQVEMLEGLVRHKESYLILFDALRLLPDEELEALAIYMRETWQC